MDKLITIKPFDLDEVRVSTASPITNKRSKISKDIAEKFVKFNVTRKAALDESELKAIKPEVDTSILPSYEEILTLDKLKHKIDEINKILKEEAHASLCLSYDNIAKLFSGNQIQQTNELNSDELIIKNELEDLSIGRKFSA